jgi:L-arginine dehydrogenase
VENFMTTQNPRVLDAAAVARLLPQVDILSTLRGLFRELAAATAVQPPQSLTLFPGKKGDFISYLGVLANKGVFGVKLSPYIVTEGSPVITAWTTLVSMTTGQPLLICDAGLLTVERTAGTTALAVDELARKDARRLAIIGSGPIAAAHRRLVAGLRDWESVQVWSPQLKQRDERVAAWTEADARVRVADSAEQACSAADVILLCTSSGKPVIEAQWVRPGALVTSISTNVAHAHEVPPAFLAAAQVYCDYRTTTPDSAGEMVLAKRAGIWSADRIAGDLAELVAGSCARPNAETPVFFRSIGLGLEDIAMAEAILRTTDAH